MVKTKICTTCKKEKLLSDFGKNKSRPSGYGYYCKKCIIKRNKKWAEEHPHYHSMNGPTQRGKDWQGHLKSVRDYRRTPSGYFTTLKESRKRIGRRSVDFSREEFINWDNNQKRVCFYCDIPEEVMLKLDNFSRKRVRYYRLTIDRKNNSENYSLDNIVLACPVCNMTKGDFFSEDEFKKLARQFITPRWINQLTRT